MGQFSAVMRIPGAGHYPAGRRVQDITEGVNYHYHPGYDLAQGFGRSSHAAFHGIGYAVEFTDGSPRSGSDTPLGDGTRCRSSRRGIAHCLVGAHGGVSDTQVENNGGRHDGDPGVEDVKTDSPLFEVSHHTAGSRKPPGAASGQRYRVNHARDVQGR